jgi:glutamate racemase
MKRFSVAILSVLLLASTATAQDPVKDATTSQLNRIYQQVTPASLRNYPIGVFDSGTGGLTILEQILKSDTFNNESHAARSDGKADFKNESFIFLADQANMPYGNYPVVEKESFLDDLIVKDAGFLLGKQYYTLKNQLARQTKSPVKAIVIACNTATAYGQADIEEVLQKAGLTIKVVGVINAGAKGALEAIRQGEEASIAVVPTKGTVLSGAYPRAIERNARQKQMKQSLEVFQQGAYGLAGSIDGAREFILLDKKDNQPRDDYRGPASNNKEAVINLNILSRYGFDFDKNAMLYRGTQQKPSLLQLNSVENYLAYHLTTLMEKIRQQGDAPPLRSVVMGCTHFPFYQEAFAQELKRLRNYQEDGQYLYREHMAKEIALIDPAFFTARELYQSLTKDDRFRSKDSAAKTTRGEFYVTVPAHNQADHNLNQSGGFTYDYKYNRQAGTVASDFRAVPFDESNLGPVVLKRLQQRVPTVWALLSEFREKSQKLKK